MSTALKRALRVVLALPAIGFVVTRLRFAVSPAGACSLRRAGARREGHLVQHVKALAHRRIASPSSP